MTNSIPTIQTAMKGITELLSQDLYGQLSPRDVGVSKLLASIQGILEALYEEGVKYGREMS